MVFFADNSFEGDFVTHILSLVVTDDDGANSVADTVTITIRKTNDAPVADAGSDDTVAAGAQVQLDGTASTDDNAVASYAWEQTGGTNVTLSSKTDAQPTFTAPLLAYNGPRRRINFLVGCHR